MKTLITTATLLVAGSLVSPLCLADDAEDIKEALRQQYSAFNAEDPDGYIRYESEGHTTFGPEGGMLGRNPSLVEQRKRQQAVFDSGVRYDLHPRHTEVKVFGTSAVSTGYITGTRQLPDGSVHQVIWRRSAMWIKQKGMWKQVHRHFSSLRPPQ